MHALEELEAKGGAFLNVMASTMIIFGKWSSIEAKALDEIDIKKITCHLHDFFMT